MKKHYDWIIWFFILCIFLGNQIYNYGIITNVPLNYVILDCTLLIAVVIRMRASD